MPLKDYTSNGIFPAFYTGKDKKFNTDRLYNIICYLDTPTTINVKVFDLDENNQMTMIDDIPYNSIKELMLNWTYGFCLNNLDEEIIVGSNKYKKYDLLDAITWLKSAVDFYTLNFNDNFNASKRAKSMYNLLKDLLLSKIK